MPRAATRAFSSKCFFDLKYVLRHKICVDDEVEVADLSSAVTSARHSDADSGDSHTHSCAEPNS